MKKYFTFFLFAFSLSVNAQIIEVPPGSIIIDMGQSPQTVNNGLKPYGLVYELVSDYYTPVQWAFSETKTSRTGVDFVYNGTAYRGGCFIILEKDVTPTVEGRCFTWSIDFPGLTYEITTKPFYANSFIEIASVPKWAINADNAGITQGYLDEAEIPSSQFPIKDPNYLDACDDAFMMAHADPTWLTHRNIVNFLAPTSQGGYGGWLWAGCHAVSVLEGLSGNLYRDFGTGDALSSSNWDDINLVNIEDGNAAVRNDNTNALIVDLPITVAAGAKINIICLNSSKDPESITVASGLQGAWSTPTTVTVPKGGASVSYTIAAGGADRIRIVSNSKDIGIDAVAATFVETAKMNFLSDPTLVDYEVHDKGDKDLTGYLWSTADYGHPFMQTTTDLLAGTSGGSEQHYVPGAFANAVGGPAQWRAQTTVALYNPNFADNPGTNSVSQQKSTAKLVWGRAYGNPNWGMVMYEAGHDFKPGEGGDDNAYIAGLRTYLNFSFLSGIDDPIVVDELATNIPDQMIDGASSNITSSAQGTSSSTWECNCSGTFGDANAANTTFTPSIGMSAGDEPVECTMKIIFRDACNKEYVYSEKFIVTHPTISAPVANDDVEDRFDYQELTVDYLGNDYDPNNDDLTTTLQVAGGEAGVWTDNGDGTVSFAPTNGSANNYTATTTYQICKTSTPSSCDIATITLTVIPNTCAAGEAPDILSNISYGATAGTSLNVTDKDEFEGAPDGVLAIPSNGVGPHTLAMELDISGPSNTPITFLPQDSLIVFKVRTSAVSEEKYATAQTSTGFDDPSFAVGVPSNTLAEQNSLNAELILELNNGASVPAGIVIEIEAQLETKELNHLLQISSGGSSTGPFTNPVNIATQYPDKGDPEITLFYTIPAGGATHLKLGEMTAFSNDIIWKFFGIKYDSPLPTKTITFDVKASPSVSEPTWSGVTNTQTLKMFSDGGIQNVAYNVPSGGARWLQVSNIKIDGVVGSDGEIGFDGITFDAGDVDCINADPIAEDDILTTELNTSILIDMDDYISHPTGINSIDWLTFAISSDVTNGTTSFNSTTHEVTYTPSAGFLGIDNFTYTIEDNNGDAASNIIAIVILNPPVAVDDIFYVDSDNNNTPTGNILTNDFDINDFEIELSEVEGLSMTPAGLTNIPTADGGLVNVDENGDFTYTPPNVSYQGDDSFEYTICNSSDQCNTATVIITVNTHGASLNPPHASNDNTWVFQNESTTIDVLGNDNDLDNDLDVTSITAVVAPSNGSVVYNADGTVTYTPSSDYLGDDSFSYLVCDLQPVCDTARVNVTVVQGQDVLINAMPNALDDYNVTEAETQIAGNILDNDSDRDGDDLSVTTLNGVSLIGVNTNISTPNGQITINPDGSYVYQANNGFFGTDVFTYTVCDDELLCSEATIYIQVTDCEIDSDGDGVLNCDDVDDDNDGIKDIDEGFTVDSDGDGVPNYLDLDSDNDGIADVIEAGGVDPDNDGVYGAGPITDVDGDGLHDAVDDHDGGSGAGEVITTGIDDTDTDSDGVPNRVDLDSDNDGIVDVIEGQSTLDYIAPTGEDDDLDGIDNAFDSDFNAANSFVSPYDFDGDTTPDYKDLDSDDDTQSDQLESGVTADVSANDADGDGILDDYDNFNNLDPPATGLNVDNDGQTATNPFPIGGATEPDNTTSDPDWRYGDDVWTASGTVWNDPNGLTDGVFNGTATGEVPVGPAQLYVNYSIDGIVQATVAVTTGDGTWSLASLKPHPSGTFQLSTTQGVVNNPTPASTLVNGWGFAGEGFAPSGDGELDGNFTITLTQNETDVDFAFEQAPQTSIGTISDVSLPTGTNTFLIEPSNIIGTDVDGTISSFRITQWPTNTAAVYVGSVIYYESALPVTCPAGFTCALFPVEGVIVEGSNTTPGNPTEVIRIDPIETNITPGSNTVDLSIAAIDNAGVEDATPVVHPQTFNSDVRTLTIAPTTICGTKDIPQVQLVINSNFNPTGLTAVVTWTGGTPDAGLSNPLGVAIVDQVIETYTITGVTGSAPNFEATVTSNWPGSENSGGVGTNWPGWVDDPTDGWIAQEDGYSGYRASDTKIEVQINPADDAVLSYPPASPTCTTNPPAPTMSGTVFRDEDGSGQADFTSIQNGGELGTDADGTGLYVIIVGEDPNDNTDKVYASTAVNSNGTYTFSDYVRNPDHDVYLSTSAGTVGSPTLPSEVLPNGWATAGATPIKRVAVNTLIASDGDLDPFNFGIHERPTSTNESQAPILLPTGTGEVTVDNTKFNAIDPDLSGGNDNTLGGITELKLTQFPANATSITIGSVTYTSATWPGDVVLNTTIAGGVLSAVNDVITIDPAGKDDIKIYYAAVDVAGGENQVDAELTIPVDVVKWNGTAWDNGYGPDGNPGGGDDGPPGPGDGGNTVYILNESGNTPTIARLEESAVIGDLVFEDDVNGDPHGLDINAAVASGDPGTGACLSISTGGVVSNQGKVRMLSKSDSEYGQYKGPALTNAEFQMVMEKGWHNIGIPMSDATMASFVTDNDPEVVNNTGVEATHNLWWYDTKESSGEEHGFYRNDNGKTYGTHSYGTWHMYETGVLHGKGYNFFLDENNSNTLPHVVKVTGATNADQVTYTTHDNWGGWSLIPNIYPVTISASLMESGGFFGTEFDKAVWIWNPNDGYTVPGQGQFRNGSYVALDAENGSGTGVVIDPDGQISVAQVNIAPMQAFYIRRTNGSQTRRPNYDGVDPDGMAPGQKVDPAISTGGDLSVMMHPDFRTDCQSIQHYKTSGNFTQMLLAVYDASNHQLNDASSLVFADHYTNGYDLGYDISKNSSGGEGAPTLFSVLDDKALVINKLEMPMENTTVPLGFYSDETKGNYKFGIADIPGGWTVFLEDKMTGAWHDMQLGQYAFNNNVNFKVERFVLHFNMFGAPIESVYGPSTKAWRTDEGIEVSFTNIKAKQAEIVVTNLAGQLLFIDRKASTEGNYIIPMDNAVEELFIVTVKSIELNESHKVVR